MLALDRRAGRAAVEIASLFDLAGDAARFARPGNRGVSPDLDMRGRANARFAAADEEATSPTEGGGPLAPVAGYCAAAPRRGHAAARRVHRRAALLPHGGSARRGDDGHGARDALGPEVLRAVREPGIARHWNPPVPAAVAALPATGDGFGDFVKRHEPGERVFASAANGSATLAEVLDQRRTARVPTRYAAKIDLARTPRARGGPRGRGGAAPRAAFGHWFGDAQPVHAYVSAAPAVIREVSAAPAVTRSSAARPGSRAPAPPGAMETDPRLARFYKDVTPRKRLRTAVDFVRTCGDAAHECEFLTENAWRIIETCFETVEQYERMTSGEWEQDAPKARPIAFAKCVLRGEKVIEERDWSDVFFLVRRVIEASAAAGLAEGLLERAAASWCVGGSAAEQVRCTELLEAALGGELAEAAEWADGEASAAAFAGHRWTGQKTPAETRLALVEEFLKCSATRSSRRRWLALARALRSRRSRAAAGPGDDADAGVEEDSAFGDACVETVELFRTFAATPRAGRRGASTVRSATASSRTRPSPSTAPTRPPSPRAWRPTAAGRWPRSRWASRRTRPSSRRATATATAATRWAALRDKVRRVVDVYAGAAVHRRGCPWPSRRRRRRVRCAFCALLAAGPESRDWCARWAANLASDGAGVDPDAAAPDDDVAVRETLGGHACASGAAAVRGPRGVGRVGRRPRGVRRVGAGGRGPAAPAAGLPPRRAAGRGRGRGRGAAGAAGLASRPKPRDPKAAPRTGAPRPGARRRRLGRRRALARRPRGRRRAAAPPRRGARRALRRPRRGSPWPRAARPLRRRVIGLVVAAVGRELDRGGAAAPPWSPPRGGAALAAVSRRLVAPAVAAAAACALDDAPGAAWARATPARLRADAPRRVDGPDAPDLGAKIGGAVAACARDAVRGADAALARALSSAASVVRAALAPAGRRATDAAGDGAGPRRGHLRRGAAAARDDAGGLGEVGEAAAARRKACRGVAIAAGRWLRELLELGAEGAAVVAVLLRCVLANGAAALARALEDLPGDAPGGLEFERWSPSASRPRREPLAGRATTAAAGLRALGAWLPLRDASRRRLRFLAAAALHDGSRDDAARIVAAFVRADAASQVNLPQRIVADVERRLREDDLDGLFDDAVHECRALVANDNLQRFLDKAGADRGAALAPKRVRLSQRPHARRQREARARPGRRRRRRRRRTFAPRRRRGRSGPRPARPRPRSSCTTWASSPAPTTTGAVALAAGRRARRRRARGPRRARAVEAAAARPPPVVLDAPPGDAAFATPLRSTASTARCALRAPGDGAAAPTRWSSGSRARRRRRARGAAADGAGAATPTPVATPPRLYRLDATGFRRRRCRRSSTTSSAARTRSARRRGPRGRLPRRGRALASPRSTRGEPSDPPASVYAALVQREAPRPVAVIPPGKAV
ncbi:tRNA-Phe hydroxylase [Aureococcus anophagefferens]|nr:tRNA-Phe hydroxylase [Aureococcus anophagefferens]